MGSEKHAVKSGRRASTGPAARASAKPGRQSLLGRIYGIGTWLQFLILGALVVPILLLTPGLTRRRALVSRLARLALRLAGMRLKVQGLGRLPQPCIVVANHSSYLDGVVLCATLPPWFSFVIKREMASVPLAGTLLRRIGAEFVERGDRKRSARDARRLLRQAEIGQALVFFPEGTFGAEIGLQRFHVGAFAAAVRANLPLIPVAIRGTRHCLPAGSPWPRPGTISIEALALLPTAVSGRESDERDHARQLRDAARGALLAALGEPDLDKSARH
jgi:1-acyl-sn-glycerol-3-phosphate acyltransferase